MVSRYPNTQVPSTLWYHDHVLGMTRLNVYAGPAGFWLLRSDDPADNPTVAGSGAPAMLPGPAPQTGEPPGTRHFEIPLAIQDRAFQEDGSLFYPDSRAFFDGYAGPYVPDTEVPPMWNPEFFGNCMVVNGRTWPFLDVEPRRYRFRVLNGCNARFLILRVRDPRVAVWKIGNEAGYLPAAMPVRNILLAPAERADLVIDFSRMPLGSTATLLNLGPDSPFGGGGFRPADPRTTGRVMQFRVVLPVPAGLRRPQHTTRTADHAASHSGPCRGAHPLAGAGRGGARPARSRHPDRSEARHLRPVGRAARRGPRPRVARTGHGESSGRRLESSGRSTTSPRTPTPSTSTRCCSRSSTAKARPPDRKTP